MCVWFWWRCRLERGGVGIEREENKGRKAVGEVNTRNFLLSTRCMIFDTYLVFRCQIQGRVGKGWCGELIDDDMRGESKGQSLLALQQKGGITYIRMDFSILYRRTSMAPIQPNIRPHCPFPAPTQTSLALSPFPAPPQTPLPLFLPTSCTTSSSASTHPPTLHNHSELAHQPPLQPTRFSIPISKQESKSSYQN